VLAHIRPSGIRSPCGFCEPMETRAQSFTTTGSQADVRSSAYTAEGHPPDGGYQSGLAGMSGLRTVADVGRADGFGVSCMAG
jgi:hypothetical protein